MSKLFPSKPLVALKRTANLGNILVNTKPLSTPSDNLPHGTHSCGSSRCQICKSHTISEPFIKSNTNSSVFPIKHHITCNSKNVIYVISCSKCGVQYTGQTTTSLRIRFNNHKSSIRRNDPSQTVAVHFNSADHNGISDVRIQGVEIVVASQLNARESAWIWNLGSHKISGGLNDKETFLQNLTLHN